MAEKTNSAVSFVRQNFFAIAAVSITVLNLWLASKLYPLAESIALLDVRTAHCETNIDRLEETLIRFEGKLDRVIENK